MSFFGQTNPDGEGASGDMMSCSEVLIIDNSYLLFYMVVTE